MKRNKNKTAAVSAEKKSSRVIKILHIYSDAMDLYGDYFNVTCIKQSLKAKGFECKVDELGIGDEINPEGYDMVYMGHGKARNLAAVSEYFVKYGDAVKKSVENGTVFFVTGSARLLFGKEFLTMDGETKQGIGLFDYIGEDTGKVFTSDVVGKLITDGGVSDITTYGFINRTHYIDGVNKYPLFKVIKGAGDGAGEASADGFEGTLYKNFFGTWQMGPLLARNPAILEEIVKRILGKDYKAPAKKKKQSLEEKALELTLSEFKLDK